jgi:microcystin-dependent protein
MAKTKISEFDSTPANNTDIDSINIAEGCAPSGINNAIRELMSQLKDQQTGASGDGFTVAGTLTSSGTLAVTGAVTLDGAAGTTGQVLLSAGSGNTPTWGASFVSGMIMLWSGSIATIPTGWVLCDGTNSTPNLRDRFVVGAGTTYAVAANGGSANAIVVSHTHTATSTVTDPQHSHVMSGTDTNGAGGDAIAGPTKTLPINNTFAASTGITVATTIASTGDNAANANLPPYYALAYIMKT